MVIAAPPASRADRRLLVLGAAVMVAALFAFCHPYIGIRGDAVLYVVRALADLDPGDLGRDLMVVDDGQMRFSLFPILLRPLIAALGASYAAMLVAAVGSAAWLAALAALAWKLAPGRTAWAMVVMVAVLPLSYGDHNIFFFAETSATPRPLAEAAVMYALAALLAGRWVVAAVVLVLGTLIHPIMTVAGLGVAALFLLSRLPVAWRIVTVALAVATALAVLVSALLGVAPFDRLIVRPDPEWFDLLRLRSPHLFPTLWTGNSFAPLLAQTATIIVAARRVDSPRRVVLVGALAVCAIGLATDALLGDTLHLLPFIQTQMWRTTWLIAVLGGCALALCTGALWRDAARGRIVLALLWTAWFFQPTPVATSVAAGLAVALELGAFGTRLRLTEGHAAVAILVAAILALAWAAGPVLGYLQFLRDLPPGEHPSTLEPLRNNLQSLPVCAVIAAWLVAPAAAIDAAVASFALSICCIACLAAGAIEWDQRSVVQSYLERPQAPPGFATLASGHRREVFWVGSNADTWLALRRPQYFSPQQAASIVFSRPLAREWKRRADALIRLGLVQQDVFTPWIPAADDDREKITQAAIDGLCARPDAPGLVVFPYEAGQQSLRDMVLWQLPAPLFRLRDFASGSESHRIDSFGIVPCAPVADFLPR